MANIYTGRMVRKMLKDIQPERTAYFYNCANVGKVLDMVSKIERERRHKKKPLFWLHLTDEHLTERTLLVYCRPVGKIGF